MTNKEAAGIMRQLISQAIVLGRASGKPTIDRIRIEAIYKAVEALEKQATADAVPVVRCRDCAVPHNKYIRCPKLNGLVTPPDFYCPFRERKDGEYK